MTYVECVTLREGFYREDVPLYGGYFRSERRCPKCNHALTTNGKGTFVCLICDYRDHQDVSKLKYEERCK